MKKSIFILTEILFLLAVINCSCMGRSQANEELRVACSTASFRSYTEIKIKKYYNNKNELVKENFRYKGAGPGSAWLEVDGRMVSEVDRYYKNNKLVEKDYFVFERSEPLKYDGKMQSEEFCPAKITREYSSNAMKETRLYNRGKKRKVILWYIKSKGNIKNENYPYREFGKVVKIAVVYENDKKEEYHKWILTEDQKKLRELWNNIALFFNSL